MAKEASAKVGRVPTLVTESKQSSSGEGFGRTGRDLHAGDVDAGGGDEAVVFGEIDGGDGEAAADAAAGRRRAEDGERPAEQPAGAAHVSRGDELTDEAAGDVHAADLERLVDVRLRNRARSPRRAQFVDAGLARDSRSGSCRLRAPRRRARRSSSTLRAKASALCCENSVVKGRTTVASMPVVASRSRRSASVGVMRRGPAPGRSRWVGCGSKVTATERARSERARSTTRPAGSDGRGATPS